MQDVDTLIHARWIVPVEPHGAVLEHHSLAIRQGRIAALVPTAQADGAYRAREQVRLDGHALIPGLVNAHTHAAMSLFRGYADDLPLMEWLTRHLWPAEARCVDRRFVRDGTALAIAEMIRGGTTCFNDMYFFPDETASVAIDAGMRAVVGLIVLDFPTAWAADADEYLVKGQQVHDDLRHAPLIRTAFAPHAPYTVSDAPLERIGILAEELNVPIHLHVHETEQEIADSLERHGARPLARLDRLGLLSPRLLAVHATQLEPGEIDRLAAAGVHVIHCPESNLKLASGFCPVEALRRAGVNVALGTDGAASNNDLDLLGELRTAALLAKGVSRDAAALPAADALRAATLHGARALDLDQVTGSLEPGKAADIAAIRLADLECQPVYHPVSQIVYAAGRRQVTDVWVAGRRLLETGRLTTLDGDALAGAARRWADTIKQVIE